MFPFTYYMSCVFRCLVRVCPCTSLFTKSIELLCLVCKTSFCVFVRLVNWKVSGLPCTSSPHKGVQAFVCMFLSLAYVFGCLGTGKVLGNHAPLLFTKAFKLCIWCV